MEQECAGDKKTPRRTGTGWVFNEVQAPAEESGIANNVLG